MYVPRTHNKHHTLVLALSYIVASPPLFTHHFRCPMAPVRTFPISLAHCRAELASALNEHAESKNYMYYYLVVVLAREAAFAAARFCSATRLGRTTSNDDGT